MDTKLIFIRRIAQKDQYTFTIEWTDGKISLYRLSDLQRHCPCAKCCDEKADRSSVDLEEVQAVSIESVGRYALKIDFIQGCSKGIYSFSLLRELEV